MTRSTLNRRNKAATLGEKIEMIFDKKQNFPFGLFKAEKSGLMNRRQVTRVWMEIDGVPFCVIRCVDASMGWFWTVNNLNTGVVVEFKGEWDLCYMEA